MENKNGRKINSMMNIIFIYLIPLTILSTLFIAIDLHTLFILTYKLLEPIYIVYLIIAMLEWFEIIYMVIDINSIYMHISSNIYNIEKESEHYSSVSMFLMLPVTFGFLIAFMGIISGSNRILNVLIYNIIIIFILMWPPIIVRFKIDHIINKIAATGISFR